MAAGYRHIVWDWNGTLLDDTWLCHELGNEQLRKHGLRELSLEEFRELFTTPVRTFYERIGFDFERVAFEALSRDFHEDYKGRRHECRLHHDSAQVLASLSAQKITHSILSAHGQEMLQEIVLALQIMPHFTHVVGLQGVPGQSKIEEGKKWLGDSALSPHEILVVGDTLHDLEVAQHIGADCVLVARGFQSEKLLRESGAPVVRTLLDLEAIILKEN